MSRLMKCEDMKKIMTGNLFECLAVVVIQCIIALGDSFFHPRLEANGSRLESGLSECKHLNLNITNIRRDLSSFKVYERCIIMYKSVLGFTETEEICMTYSGPNTYGVTSSHSSQKPRPRRYLQAALAFLGSWLGLTETNADST